MLLEQEIGGSRGTEFGVKEPPRSCSGIKLELLERKLVSSRCSVFGPKGRVWARRSHRTL